MHTEKIEGSSEGFGGENWRKERLVIIHRGKLEDNIKINLIEVWCELRPGVMWETMQHVQSNSAWFVPLAYSKCCDHATGWMIVVQFQTWPRNCSLLKNVQTSSVAHPASYWVGTRNPFASDKVVGMWYYNHLLPSSTKVKYELRCASTPPVCLCGMHWDNFTIYIVPEYFLSQFSATTRSDPSIWHTHSTYFVPACTPSPDFTTLWTALCLFSQLCRLQKQIYHFRLFLNSIFPVVDMFICSGKLSQISSCYLVLACFFSYITYGIFNYRITY